MRRTWVSRRITVKAVVMAGTSSTEPEVLVSAGSQRVQVTGRAALIIGQIVLHASAINQIPVGRVVADFAQGKTKLEVTQSFSAVRVELGPAPAEAR